MIVVSDDPAAIIRLDILNSELRDKVRAKVVFGHLKISESFDRIEAALELDSRHELTYDALGKIAEIDGYPAMIDPDKPTRAGGQRERPHNIQGDNMAKNLDQGLTKNREGLD